MSLDPVRREEILERIGQWLEEWDGPYPEELDPAITDAERLPADLSTLAAGTTAVAQELKLQGKAFRQLDARTGPLEAQVTELVETVGCLAGRFEAAASTHRDEISAARAEGRGESLTELLELHDRLVRTADAARGAGGQLGRLARWGKAEPILEGVADGVRLVLERLEEILRRHDVTRLDTTGAPFDPHTMRAVGTVASAEYDDGDVAETVRAGFRRGQELIRPAEVRIARRATRGNMDPEPGKERDE